MSLKDAPMEGDFEKRIHRILIDRGETLSLAESATGGALSTMFTRLPGASAYFLGSVIAYSNELKKASLHVSEKALNDFGAVSSEVVEEMAWGVKRLTGSDFSVAISGIAGPSGATPTKPVGFMWAAIIDRQNRPLIWSFHLEGTRVEIIEKTVQILLEKLLVILKKDE